MKTTLHALRILLVFTLLTGVIYPLAVTGISKVLFAKKANGSLVVSDGKIFGSELLAQKFDSPQYFWSRPSAADYATIASGASNKGPTSGDLAKAIDERRAKLGPGAPGDLLTASGSGLDPHISPEAAEFQLPRVAAQLAVFLERERALAANRLASVVRESEKLQRALFDSVSHELKTPLAAIAAALEQPQPDTGEIRQANDRLRRTVDLLLDATRLDSGLLQPKPEWCDASEIVHDARVRAGLPPEAVTIEISSDLPHIRTDPGLVSQALAMLLSNAVTHGPQHGSPACRVQGEGDCIRFDVQDRGPGLPPGSEEAIFARFQRGAHAKPGGLGLGLSIARQLATALGATLTGANRQDGGACFTLRIPIGGEFMSTRGPCRSRGRSSGTASPRRAKGCPRG